MSSPVRVFRPDRTDRYGVCGLFCNILYDADLSRSVAKRTYSWGKTADILLSEGGDVA